MLMELPHSFNLLQVLHRGSMKSRYLSFLSQTPKIWGFEFIEMGFVVLFNFVMMLLGVKSLLGLIGSGVLIGLYRIFSRKYDLIGIWLSLYQRSEFDLLDLYKDRGSV